jgi:hypothetical protein
MAANSHQHNLQFKEYVEYFCQETEGKEPIALQNYEEEVEEMNEGDRFCRYCRQPGQELISPCDCKGGTLLPFVILRLKLNC